VLDLEKFESLGDNCELGFVQRFSGVEAGGLLRWAIVPPEALISAIRGNFEQVFEYENLTPSAPDMVRDEKYGLAFHTQMHSQNGIFHDTEEKRREIHAGEKQKIDYMAEKLRGLLRTGEKIFVYKRNVGVDAETALEIGRAISEKGPGKLLYVTTLGNQPIGTVRCVSENLFEGRIDRFADYAKADDVSQQVWGQILKDANTKMAV